VAARPGRSPAILAIAARDLLRRRLAASLAHAVKGVGRPPVASGGRRAGSAAPEPSPEV